MSPRDDKKHFQALNKAAELRGLIVVQDATMRMLDGSCLYYLARRDRQYRNYVISGDWEYAEVSFKARGPGVLSSFKKKWVDYAVMRVDLPRRLPNVVFDSVEHQRQQFRVTFDPRQYIQLEGNFNTYFATYFGTGYTIDDLSFITPEVMEALISAKKYDIEIVHDSLLLFGTIQSDPEAQIQEMSHDLMLIRKKLLHNILTYRDERVPYDEGRRVVARAGMFLGRRPMGLWGSSVYALFWLALVILGTVLVVFLAGIFWALAGG